MYQFQADVTRNRLYISLKGRLYMEELKAARELFIQEVKRLSPGFICISDVSEFSPANEESRIILQETLSLIRSLGVGKIIRVQPGGIPARLR